MASKQVGESDQKTSVHWGELQEEGGHCKSRYSYKSENFTDE